MKHKVEQPNHYTVIITLEGGVDLKKLEPVYSGIEKTILAPATEPVYFIFDVTQIENFNVYIPNVQEASEAILKNKKVAAIFMIGIPNSLVNFVATKTISPSHLPAYNVESVEEALNLIDTSRGGSVAVTG